MINFLRQNIWQNTTTNQWELRHLHTKTNYAFLTDEAASTLQYPVGRWYSKFLSSFIFCNFRFLWTVMNPECDNSREPKKIYLTLTRQVPWYTNICWWWYLIFPDVARISLPAITGCVLTLRRDATSRQIARISLMRVPVLPWIFQVRSLNSFDLSIYMFCPVSYLYRENPTSQFYQVWRKATDSDHACSYTELWQHLNEGAYDTIYKQIQ